MLYQRSGNSTKSCDDMLKKPVILLVAAATELKECAAMQRKDTHECAACNDARTFVKGEKASVHVLRMKLTKFAD